MLISGSSITIRTEGRTKGWWWGWKGLLTFQHFNLSVSISFYAYLSIPWQYSDLTSYRFLRGCRDLPVNNKCWFSTQSASQSHRFAFDFSNPTWLPTGQPGRRTCCRCHPGYSLCFCCPRWSWSKNTRSEEKTEQTELKKTFTRHMNNLWAN